jgi:hypothetical protein
MAGELGKPVIPTEVLIPVWGTEYVARFLNLVLPSWIAPGNLPALGAGGRLRIRLLGRELEISRLQRSSAVQRLEALADVEATAIDDLLAPGGAVGAVNLTLAYQRGLCLAEPGARVVLLNADFVLADGSLATVRRRLDDGAAMLLAPSLRTGAELVQIPLAEAVDEDGVLSREPRWLVGLAMDRLHATSFASCMDQQNVRLSRPHQLLWRADATTLIVRSFCLFPLAIELKARPEGASSFCDHGLFPALRPGVRPQVLDDSDTFFALELAQFGQDAALVETGAPSPDEIGASLSAWTNRFHRTQAESTIFLRAGPPSPSVAETRAACDRFTSELLGSLGPPLALEPNTHWEGGVAEWRRLRQQVGRHDSPQELKSVREAARPDPGGARRLAASLLVGTPGARLPWQPLWGIEQTIARRAKLGQQNGVTVVSIGRFALSPFDTGFAKIPSVASPDGANLVLLAADFSNAEMPEWLAREALRISQSGATLLLVAFNGAAPLEAMHLAQGMAALRGLDVVALQEFDLEADRKAQALHGLLAASFGKAGAVQRLILAAAAAATALRLIAINTFRSRPRRLWAAVIAASPKYQQRAASTEPRSFSKSAS